MRTLIKCGLYLLSDLSAAIIWIKVNYLEKTMGTNNDTTLHQLAYVLNKNCSANDLQIYTNGSNEESVGLFHFAHACFLLGTIHILRKLKIPILDKS